MKTPLAESTKGVRLVEVAGQLIRVFRYGLDYAFTQRLCIPTMGAGRVIRRSILDES
jgi:hypothetical protein